MKRSTLPTLLIPLLALSVAVVGCSKPAQTEAPAAPPAAVNAPPPAMPTPPPAPAASTQPAMPPAVTQPAVTAPTDPYAKLLAAFASSDASTKSSVNDAVAAMKAGKYAEAVTLLQKLIAEGKLTPEQLPLIKDLLVQAQKQVVSSTAQQAASDAQKAVPEVPKSLPLGQ